MMMRESVCIPEEEALNAARKDIPPDTMQVAVPGEEALGFETVPSRD